MAVFLREASRSDNVPNCVAGDEILARFCDRRVPRQALKSGGKIKASALYASKLPFEFSVYRTAYCDEDVEARAQGKGGIVHFETRRVRGGIRGAWVLAAKPPPAHAEILLPCRAARFRRFDTKGDVQALARAWSEYSFHCERLAELARGAREVTPPSEGL